MTVPERSAAVVAIAALLVLSLAGSAGIASGATPTGSADLAGGSTDEPPRQATTPTPTGDNTTQHENPDDTDEAGDLGDIQGWLTGALADRLSGSAIQISQGQYEAGRQLLGDSYDDLLGKFVDVAGETDSESDDQAAGDLEKAKEEQQELASTTSEYRETLRAYREARENGNVTRARRLARQLNRLAGDVNSTVSSLNRTYRRIEDLTGASLGTARETILSIRENITSQQAAINDDLFVETTLVARADQSAVSFRNPTSVTGRLRVENGSAVANQTIRLRVGERVVRTTTDGAGRFSVPFRPTMTPLGQQTIPVAYLPTNRSVYLPAETTIRVTVSQVTPTLSLQDTPERVSFGDRVRVTGRVSADGVGAETVPVVVTLDGIRLGTARTDATGDFETTVRIPASVRNGSRQLRVRLPLTGQALAGVTATRQVRVESTATTLTVSGEADGPETVSVSGRLTTATGSPLSDQEVGLRLDGESSVAVRTGSEGRFTTTVSVPTDSRPADNSQNLTLVAEYTGAQTNLEPARATTTVLLSADQASSGGDSSGTDSNDTTAGAGSNGGDSAGIDAAIETIQSNPFVWLLAVGLLVMAGIVALLWRRSRASTETAEPAADSGDTADDATPRADASGSAEPTLPPAKAELQSGDLDSAVQTAYASVRRHLTTVVNIPDRATHWECYTACDTAGIDADRLAALRDLTESYECAAFAPESVDDEEARRAIAHAEEFANTDNLGEGS